MPPTLCALGISSFRENPISLIKAKATSEIINTSILLRGIILLFFIVIQNHGGVSSERGLSMTNLNDRSCPGVEEHDRMREELEKQLNFERLLADISARFVVTSSDRLGDEIKTAQKQICECLGIDVCALWQYSMRDPEVLRMTHIYAPADFPVPAPSALIARESFPWCLEKFKRNEAIIVPNLKSVPPEAAQDLKSWQYFGICSSLVLPLSASGEGLFSALGFAVLREEREWPADLINRLQLVAQIFSSALARKKTEDALRESEARLKLAAESANAGLWSWDYETGKIWITEKTRLLYGFLPDEEITGDRFFKTLFPDDLERIRLIVEQAFRDGSAVQTDYRIVLPDQSRRWIAISGQVFTKPSGEPDRMMGVSIDVTERKQYEVEKTQLRMELEHMVRVMMMNELSTSLAHEINQPLGAILNNASAARVLMTRDQNERDDIREILEDIVKDAKRAGDVVRKIRGFVKKNEAQFELLDMNELIEDVIALFQNIISINKVSVFFDLEKPLPKVRGDRVRLQQVLTNFIANALEAMKDSSLRTLRIRSFPNASGLITISVSDSGTGIDDFGKGKMFEPFFTTKKDGLGMGLRICKSIIEEHHGRIWAENNPAGGAAFSFSLKTWNGETP